MPINNTISKTEVYTEDKYRDDPSYTSNFLLPDTISENYNNYITFTLIPNVTITNNITLNDTDYKYLKHYSYQNHKKEEFKPSQ